MVNVYCNEGQSEASIAINGLTYISKNPPLTIEMSGGFVERRGWNQSGLTLLARHPISGVSTIYSDPSGETGVIVYFPSGSILLLDGTSNPDYIELASFTFSDYPFGVPAYYFYEDFFSVRDSSLFIYSQIGIPLYTIKCDGCGAGECKGSADKYPGYVCMDCLKMQNHLKSIKGKLNEF